MRNHPIRCLLILLIKTNYYFYQIFLKNCFFYKILKKKEIKRKKIKKININNEIIDLVALPLIA
jgi:hypothetical protein